MLTDERRPNTIRATCPLTSPRTAEKRERMMEVHRVNLEGRRQGGKEEGKEGRWMSGKVRCILTSFVLHLLT